MVTPSTSPPTDVIFRRWTYSVGDPTALCYLRRGLDEAILFRDWKYSMNMLMGLLVRLVATTFGNLCPSAQAFLQSVADVACSTGVLDRGLWLRTAQQCLIRELVRGSGLVLRYVYQSVATSAGKDFCDGAVVAYE